MGLEEKEKRELKEFLQAEKKEESKIAKIFFDGKQYNLRIPKKFVEVIEKSHEAKITDFLFEFTLEKPAAHSEENLPKLKGVLKESEEIN